MKKILPILVTSLLLSAASMAHGTQQAPPTSSEHSAPSMQQDSQPASMASSANRGDKVVSGCLRSKDGKYKLESKHHKTFFHHEVSLSLQSIGGRGEALCGAGRWQVGISLRAQRHRSDNGQQRTFF